MYDTGTYVRYEGKEVFRITVLGSIPASSDTMESKGRQMKQCRIKYIKKEEKKSENLPVYICKKESVSNHSVEYSTFNSASERSATVRHGDILELRQRRPLL